MVSFNLKDIVKPSINEIEKYIPGESLSTNNKEKYPNFLQMSRLLKFQEK